MQNQADPALTSEERETLHHHLAASATGFRAAILHPSPALWTWTPSPDRWSIAQVAEHVVMVERVSLEAIRRALQAPPDPDWQRVARLKTRLLLRALPNRAAAVEAPPPLQPSGRLSHSEVSEAFERQREQIAVLLADDACPWKQHTFAHPLPELGPLNAYQWLLFLGLHTQRHCGQIDELRAACALAG